MMTPDEYTTHTLALVEWFRSRNINESDACIIIAALVACIMKVSFKNNPANYEGAMDAFVRMLRAGDSSDDTARPSHHTH